MNNLLRVAENDSLYDELEHLRKVRNRMHIQNAQYQLDKDECNVYTDENLLITQNLLERICEVLCHVYPRPNRDFISMAHFPRPWNN